MEMIVSVIQLWRYYMEIDKKVKISSAEHAQLLAQYLNDSIQGLSP